MNNSKKVICLLAIVALFAANISAQGITTPYSLYGYGMINDNATSSQRAMGGVGYAMNSGRQINVMNPASYASIDSLTFLFDMGVTATSVWSKDGDASSKDFGGGLDYVTMQFPISRYIGASIGLLPYSSVGYSFGSEISNGASSYSGSGGLNQLYGGLAVRPFNGFTVGANISYLFGTNINDSYAVSDDSQTSLFERVVQVRDYHLQFGVQYALKVGKRDKVSVGVTYQPKKGLSGHAWAINYDVNNDTAPDTVDYISTSKHYSLPETWGAGVSYEWNERLMVEADVTYQAWKDAKYTMLNPNGNTLESFNDRWKYAVGMQYTPRVRGSFLQRVNYRAGAYYSKDYIKVGDNSLREYGVTCGFGLPAPNSKSIINIGFEWKHRQATPAALIKENYFNVTLGINFNELWFFKNKLR